MKAKVDEIEGKIDDIDAERKKYDLTGRGTLQIHHNALVKLLIECHENTQKAKIKYEEAKAQEKKIDERVIEAKRKIEKANETYGKKGEVRKLTIVMIDFRAEFPILVYTRPKPIAKPYRWELFTLVFMSPGKTRLAD